MYLLEVVEDEEGLLGFQMSEEAFGVYLTPNEVGGSGDGDDEVLLGVNGRYAGQIDKPNAVGEEGEELVADLAGEACFANAAFAEEGDEGVVGVDEVLA